MSSTTTLMNYAAPEDRHLLVEWEKYLLAYQQAGQITLWSDTHHLADQTDQSQFQSHLATVQVIVLLLSNDFFANSSCQALMEEALGHLRNGQPLTIISLLLRPSAWAETALAFLPYLPTDKRPIVEWEDQNRVFQHCALALKTLLPGVFPGTISSEPDRGHTPARLPVPVSSKPDQSSLQVQAPAPVTRYQSCFISYAHQDEPFARSLYQDLLARGVPCWLAPHDLQVGTVFRQTIDDTIHKHEKLLLILSKHSIESTWTRDEVEAAMYYERREQRQMLFPISLDTSFKTSNVAWVQTIYRAIHIGFMNWSDPQTYAEGLERLLGDLKTDSPFPIIRPWPVEGWSTSEEDTAQNKGKKASPGTRGRKQTPEEIRLTKTVMDLQDELLRTRTVVGVPKSEASTGLAIAGLVLGIASILLLCVYGFGAFVGIVGLIVSIFGMRNPSVRGMALTGLILSSVSMLAGGGFLCLLSQAMLHTI